MWPEGSSCREAAESSVPGASDVTGGGARGTRPRPGDLVSLCLAWLASLRRQKLERTGAGAYEEFYEGFFEDKDLEAAREDDRKRVRRDVILSLIGRLEPAPKQILEVGCGVGDLLRVLPDRYSVAGVEFASGTLARARKLVGAQVDLRQGSILDLPIPSESQDLCICLEVLEHIEDDVRAVRELHRVLRPGGVVVASVPYTYYWRPYRRWIGHFRHYTASTFSKLLQDAGFSVEAHLPNFPGWHSAYARGYFLVRLQSLTFGRLTGDTSPYTFRLPWRAERAIERVRRTLAPILERESRLPYAALPTSTFIAARKIA